MSFDTEGHWLVLHSYNPINPTEGTVMSGFNLISSAIIVALFLALFLAMQMSHVVTTQALTTDARLKWRYNPFSLE